jgi:hypothetical protein
MVPDTRIVLDEKFNTTWDSPSLPFNLTLFFFIRFFATAVSATVAIPCGIFTPVFALGAVLGRLFGEIIAFVAPSSVKIVPAGYAIVGAASFTAGVTGTFSIAVIVFELTQELTYMVPVLLAVLLGRAIAGFLSLDMYETIARDKSLPQWPDLTTQASYALVATDLMEPVPFRYIIKRHQTLSSLTQILNATKDDDEPKLFPVVDDENTMVFLGAVERDEVIALVQSRSHCLKGNGNNSILKQRQNPLSLIPPADDVINNSDDNYDAEKEKEGELRVSPRAWRQELTREWAVAGLTEPQSETLRGNVLVDLVSCELLSLDAETNVKVGRNSFASKLILLMSVHKSPELFVTDKGKLIGVIYASQLVERSRNLSL